jgi:hypothetical protein
MGIKWKWKQCGYDKRDFLFSKIVVGLFLFIPYSNPHLLAYFWHFPGQLGLFLQAFGKLEVNELMQELCGPLSCQRVPLKLCPSM